MSVEVGVLCVLVVCIGILFVSVVALTGIILQQHSKLELQAEQLNQTFQPQLPVPDLATTHLFTAAEAVDFVCICLAKHKATHYDVLEAKLKAENIALTWFPGIDGHDVQLDDYPLTAMYKRHFEEQDEARAQGIEFIDYRGHLGCTVSHLHVISQMQRMTVILEDDCHPVPHFRDRLQNALGAVSRVDPTWEVLLLGWSCNYNDDARCKLMDTEPIHPGGVVKVHFWIGGWAYVIRSPGVARKIMSWFTPIKWHVDIGLAMAAQAKHLNVYGLVPTLAPHSGRLRISPFNHWQYGSMKRHKTDTNVTIPAAKMHHKK